MCPLCVPVRLFFCLRVTELTNPPKITHTHTHTHKHFLLYKKKSYKPLQKVFITKIFTKKTTDATVALFDQLQVDYECIDCLDEDRNPGLREVFHAHIVTHTSTRARARTHTHTHTHTGNASILIISHTHKH
jgi:hypothetical protein